jgi:hypothetical protein
VGGHGRAAEPARACLHGWKVTARFIEEGVGGAAQYRKTVDEILESARSKRFDP